MTQVDPGVRLLTEDEIADIVSEIPTIKSPLQDVSAVATESMINELIVELRTIEVSTYDTDSLIADLKQEIVRQFIGSVVKPGAACGMHAAEAIGSTFTQGTLNTFHLAGSAKNVSYGNDAVKELIHASEKKKNKSSTIIFKDKHLSIEDILGKKKGEIVAVNVRRLMDYPVPEYDIDTPENIIGENDVWWYTYFRLFVRNDIPTSSRIMRITLNVNALYEYKVLPSDVAKTIENQQAPQVICVYSPILYKEKLEDVTDEAGVVRTIRRRYPVAYIDIYPLEGLIQVKSQVNQEMASISYLESIILPNLDQVIIKGVPDITGIFPVITPIWRVVKSESYDKQSKKWIVYLNTRIMEITGINSDNVANLINVCGKKVGQVTGSANLMTVVEEGLDYLIVDLPEKPSNFDQILKIPPEQSKLTVKPSDIVNYCTTLDQNEAKDYSKAAESRFKELFQENPAKAEELPIIRPPSEVTLASEFVYADTEGSNLEKLLMRDDIDTNHTFSNDMYDILYTFGIEAARQFLIWELYKVSSYDNQYIDRRHIILTADYMTYQGNITKISFTGIMEQDMNTLAQATNERSMEVISKASAYGVREKVTSTSTAIILGGRIPIGTGYLKPFITEKDRRDIQREIEGDLETENPEKVDPNEFADFFENIQKLRFGTGTYVLGGEKEELIPLPNQEENFEPRIPVNIGIPSDVELIVGVPIKGKPVVSKELENATRDITESPCLPVYENMTPEERAKFVGMNQSNKLTSEFQIRPLLTGIKTEQLPVSSPGEVIPELTQLNAGPVVIPTIQTGLGIPNFLSNLIAQAETIKLPSAETVPTPLRRPARGANIAPSLIPPTPVAPPTRTVAPPISPIPTVAPPITAPIAPTPTVAPPITAPIVPTVAPVHPPVASGPTLIDIEKLLE